MIREQRFVDFRDTAADVLTSIGLREQSSTGLMQVTTKTAIDAINFSVEKGYTTYGDLGISSDKPLTYTDSKDRSSIWNLLKSDPEFNIEIAAQIVRMNADKEVKKDNIEDYSEADLIKLLALYNGRGDAAREYGEECYGWYQDFNWYN
jgi:hypothetical protein